MKDKENGLGAVIAAADANDAFANDSVRRGLQSIIMDEIVSDSATPVQIRVPDRAIERMSDFLAPWCTRAHGHVLLERFERIFTRIGAAAERAAEIKRMIVYLGVEPGGVLVYVAKAKGSGWVRQSELIAWAAIGDAEICPINAALDRLVHNG